MSKTPYFTKDRVDRPWYLVGAEGAVLGRMAQGVAKLLIGKNRPEYTPGQDCGSFVVIVNADKFTVTGNKWMKKKYYRHSGYPGGIRERTLEKRMDHDPEEVVRDAVKGMLPQNKIGNRLITKLKIFKGSEHCHEAQKPQEISVDELQDL